MKILVTGGAGFIGSNFLNLYVPAKPQHHFINLDKLTYAANLQNLAILEPLANYSFIKGDITDHCQIDQIFSDHQPDLIVNFAAESHVDRSIYGPSEFIQTNVIGTFNLLEACRKNWIDLGVNHEFESKKYFLHVSTDEVYGSLGPSDLFTEKTAYDPSSPYSASKAASDHLVRAYHRTYNLPAVITNCSNNYGPYQFPEKLIPLMVLNALEEKPLPVYGQGENIRDWLYVEDHCRALWAVIEEGLPGETYNIGGNNEWKNIELIYKLCEILAEETNKPMNYYKKLVKFVQDRPGHDLRYAVDATKIKTNLNWQPQESFETGLRKTIKWYLSNSDWVEAYNTGAYRAWLEQNYSNRVFEK